jgi:ATPase family associated with various cellular activities (AAA)
MMSEAENLQSWPEQNQAYLVAEFACLAVRVAARGEPHSHELSRLQSVVADRRAGMQSPPAIELLCERFSLSRFEREFILLCAGVEMDSGLAEICAKEQGNPSRTYVTFGFAMACLSCSHWSALTPSRPLRRFRMVEMQSTANLTAAPLKIDERLLHYLAGIRTIDPRLEPFLHFTPAPEWIADEHRSVAGEIVRLIEGSGTRLPLVHLCGDDSQGQEDIGALAAHESSLELFTVRAEELPSAGPELEQIAALWERESMLVRGALLVQCGAAGLSASGARLVDRVPGLVFVASREPVRLNRSFVRFEVNKPSPLEQKDLWRNALGTRADSLNGALNDVAEQFRLSARMIFSTGSLLGAREDQVLPAELWNACRSVTRPKLEDLAQRIVPCATWDDLVLPELQKKSLRQLAAQVRHRMRVYETWGFAAKGRRGLGVTALFAGASGTGKTMAAEVLAGELSLDLYRIDLSAVMSKYIGETEKNLKQVFDAAEEGGVLLLFDEADALFGKRSEVRDSHDRYANIEVGYLLQRMEAYQGLAVLTTNMSNSMDTAFQRRLRFTVNFPFPDQAQREEIWKRVFPGATPTRELNTKKLAQLNVTGGNIRNIALNAAFLAAEAGGPVGMAELVEASRLEAQKMERPLSESEIRGWV